MISKQAEIYLRYQAAIQKAEQLENLGHALKDIADGGESSISDTMDQLKRNWESDSKNQFLAKTGSLKEQINQSGETAISLAATLKEAAERFKAAELAALELIESKS